MARPIVRPGHLPAAFGGVDADVRHAYGVKWSGPKRFIDQAKGCLNVLRNQFESLLEGDIVWQPYEEFLAEEPDIAPPRIKEERNLWMIRVEMIHFWVVEWHYPDRVMRQFGRKQQVPPPLPSLWSHHEDQMKFHHGLTDFRKKPDWADIHKTSIEVIQLLLFRLFSISNYHLVIKINVMLCAAMEREGR